MVHHSVLIGELIRAGRLRLTRPREELLAYHDSCYLGRYNGIFDAPRQSLRAIPGLRLVEIRRAAGRRGSAAAAAAVTCGWRSAAASGSMRSAWRRSSSTQAQTVGTACPFCLAMVDLGRKVKGVEDRIQVKDIAELVAEALE